MKAILLSSALLLFSALLLTATPAQAAGDYSSRTIENGTAITITVGEVVIPATLNDSKSSQELISRLPFAMRLQRYSHDYCGVMEKPLSYDEKDVHNGWMNGDIDFARDGNYFTILFEDEERSQQYGHQITMGKIDGPLSVVKNLGSNIEIVVELAK